MRLDSIWSDSVGPSGIGHWRDWARQGKALLINLKRDRRKKMQEIKLKLKGTVPLMLHNNQAVDPLNMYYKTMKPLSAKRNKTEADLMLLGRIEWEAGLYISPEGKICIPGRNNLHGRCVHQ